MNIEDRIAAFEKLGKYLSAIDEVTLDMLADKAKNENAWFTRDSVATALSGIIKYLDPAAMKQWVLPYDLQPAKPRVVAVVMAGNIPLAGFHDFLSVLLSGNSVQIKPSSKDSVLISHLAEKLVAIEPGFRDAVAFVDQLRGFDAVIATGSDNSARYFQYYFGKYPHIIRKNRTSCAIISGRESSAELRELGRDVFTYYGLGCRSVSKIYVPAGFSPDALFTAWSPFRDVLHHHKYHNNYDYQKSILLVNKIPFFDSGFVLMQESERLVSPVSLVYFERYADEMLLSGKLAEHRDKIQCIVGHGHVAFGQAQSPEVRDYADQVDTLEFLEDLDQGH